MRPFKQAGEHSSLDPRRLFIGMFSNELRLFPPEDLDQPIFMIAEKNYYCKTHSTDVE